MQIDYRLLDDDRDVAAMIRAGRIIEAIFAQPALAAHVTGAHRPNPVPQTDEAWAEMIRSMAHTGYHSIGTCRMGLTTG